MEIRRFVIFDRVGEKPRPSICGECEEGIVDATAQNQLCRDCGALNGTGVSYVKRGFSFKFRVGTGATMEVRYRRRDDGTKRTRMEETYIQLFVKG